MSILFWINQPTILLKNKYIFDIVPNKNMEFNEKLNSITRLIILLTIVGYLITKNEMLIMLGIISIVLIVVLFYYKTNNSVKSLINKRENFENLTEKDIKEAKLVTPTKTNPMMNVLLTDIKDNPTRNQAAPAANPIIQKNINSKTEDITKQHFDDENIDKKLYRDLGDSMNLDMSMRQFYTMPNTQIANDQKSFAEFCYKDMIEPNPDKKDISFKDMTYT